MTDDSPTQAQQRTKRTPKKAREEQRRREAQMTLFITAFRETGNVSASCRAADIARTTAYEWREQYPDFVKRWEDAKEDALDKLEEEAFRRAHDGVTSERPIFYKGVEVGTQTITEYSDTLMIFLLKGGRPEKYRENIKQEVTGAGGGDVAIKVLRVVSMDDL